MSKFGFNLADAAARLTLVTEESIKQDPAVADTPLDYALRYADLGWYVLPVRRDKKPVDGYGLNSATNDPAVIRKIWGAYPQSGIAVACEKSGLVVLDIDPRNGGNSTLAQLEAQQGELYSSVVARTQSGGEHRFFRAEPDHEYPGTLGPGLDVKHKGYVVVEPSAGLEGVYRWMDGRDPTHGSYPGTAPRQLRGTHTTSDHSDQHGRYRSGSIAVAPQVYADLERALRSISPEEPYQVWFSVLQGLTRLSNRPEAYRIAREWSLRSSNPAHDEYQFDRKWSSMMREAYDVNYTTVFYLADQRNPDWRRTAEQESAPDDEPHPLSLRRAVHAGAEQVTMFEYIYDHFMSTGVNVIAGAPGVGKTTIVVPLALAAAHLCPADYALRPRIRRNVIIVTESVVQVQRTVYSVYSYGCTGMSAEDFESRIRVVAAHRLDPAVVARVAGEYREWTVDNLKADGSMYAALPLVVLDTANAVFDLENENDNAEVGRALSIMKQSFTGFPLVIISHAAKINGMLETDSLSPRGASAWTGDAQGVYTVFKDGEHHDSPRVLKAQKVRFPTAFDELTFEFHSHCERHPDILGYEEDVWFTHSTARPLKHGERTQLKLDAKEQRETDDWARLCNELVELIRREPGRSRTHYERLPLAQGGARGSQERKERAMTSLINEGSVEVVMLEKPKGRSNHYIRINEEVLASVNASQYAIRSY